MNFVGCNIICWQQQTKITMLNYSDFKNYWTKFYADAFEDAKTFWKDYAKNVEQFYKK